MNIEKEEHKQSSSDDETGWVATIVYLLFIGSISILFIVSGNSESLSLNNLGDFLAGVFSPLALLWLVLGYRQQGRELRLQANELSRTVGELERQNTFIELQLNVHVPKFDLQGINIVKLDRYVDSTPQVYIEYDVENSGGDARSVTTYVYRNVVETPGSTMRENIPFGQKLATRNSVHFGDENWGPLFVVIAGWDKLGRYFRYDFKTNHENYNPNTFTEIMYLPVKPIPVKYYVPHKP